MTTPKPITIALPKGRTLKPVAKVLAAAGVVDDGSLLAEDSRALIRKARFGGHELNMFLLKPDDVPTYVEHGTADLGICGRDVLFERDLDAYHPVDLGIGKCRLVVAGRVDSPPLPPMPRVATKYPRAAAWHFARKGVQVEIVNVQSSVELAPLTGLADVIVDLVETGATLVQNGLEVKEEILAVSTLVVANRASYKLRSPVGELVRALRATSSTGANKTAAV